MASNYKSYIEKYLISEIVSQLENEELISFTAESSEGLDGFMSSLYNIQLNTKTAQGDKERLLIAKFMRSDMVLGESSKSHILFANEIYLYSTVLPQYVDFLQNLKISSINIMDLVPSTYGARFGFIEGLSSSPHEKKSYLVLGNLKPLGYHLGPRLSLDGNHMLAMCKALGQYHALSYALRLLNNSQWERLKKGIIILPFIGDDLRTISFRLAFDRLYDFYDRKIVTNTFDRKSKTDLKLMDCLCELRCNYFDEPTHLLEKINAKVEDKAEDRKFAALLHGDYNRNNVLFKYKISEKESGDTQKLVDDIKMIDFQVLSGLRYGSPALDLSFCMYFNTAEDIRSKIWLDLLKSYHSSMFSTLSTILQASKKSKQEINEILSDYSFEKFEAHFSRFAFYGVMICIQFLPWMLCSEEECSRISKLFASDVYGEEFRKLCLEAGGDEVNMRILSVIRHACEMGYMDDL